MNSDKISSLPMWESIYHDQKTDTMFVMYADGTSDVSHVNHVFYTPACGQYGSRPCGMHDIYGKEMFEVVASGEDERMIRKQNEGPANQMAELDIDFRTRWLQRHYAGDGMLNVDMSKINICFLDIENATTGRFSSPYEAMYPVNVVTMYCSATKKYDTYGIKDISYESKMKLQSSGSSFHLCDNEADLITKVFTNVGQSNVSILSGWNFQYDYTYMKTRADVYGISLNLMSRLPGQFKKAWISKKTGDLNIAGTEVIDFLALYKKYTFSEEPSYKLDYIGNLVCHEHKDPLPDGYRSWINYIDDYTLYNFQDVRLLTLIEANAQMFHLAVMSCAEARVPFSSVFESKKMLVGFVLNMLHEDKLTFPPLRVNRKEAYAGAYVYSKPGYYKHLVSYDYRSLYPSIIMTFNISPETKVIYPIDYVLSEDEKKNLILSPWTHGGKYHVYYRKDKLGIVPQVTRKLFNGRSELKKKKKQMEKLGRTAEMNVYDMMQKVYKVLGNSLYGLLGMEYFQMYDLDNAASIPAYGQALIKNTISRMAGYLNGDLAKDERFHEAFGYYPTIDQSMVGNKTVDGDVLENRMSHGDTDSFFVKFGDIASEFMKSSGKQISVIVLDGNRKKSETVFDIADELSAKRMFNSTCKEQLPDIWGDAANFAPDLKTGHSKIQIMFHDGMAASGKIKVLYNRYRLTDFCRVFDTVIIDGMLKVFMQDFADSWGYYSNELFLKREKCIQKAIVTTKKKYICRVESNEDITYLDKKTLDPHPKMVPVGIEVVRSSTSRFSRDRLMDVVELMMDTMDKGKVRDRMIEIKKEYYDAVDRHDWSMIACPSGVKNDPPPLESYATMSDEEVSSIDWRCKSASVWNHLITHDPDLKQEPYEPVAAGGKVKILKASANPYNISAIAYTGDTVPDRLIALFPVNTEAQWAVSCADILGRLFVAVGWPKYLEYVDDGDDLSSMM